MRTALLAPFAALAFAACAPGGRDFSRPDTWRATGVNERNLRAMLVEPSHATRGIGAADERGDAGTAPVTRLVQDKRKPLPAAASRSPAPSPPAGGEDAR